jgi:hypothetical protein
VPIANCWGFGVFVPAPGWEISGEGAFFDMYPEVRKNTNIPMPIDTIITAIKNFGKDFFSFLSNILSASYKSVLIFIISITRKKNTDKKAMFFNMALIFYYVFMAKFKYFHSQDLIL